VLKLVIPTSPCDTVCVCDRVSRFTCTNWYRHCYSHCKPQGTAAPLYDVSRVVPRATAPTMTTVPASAGLNADLESDAVDGESPESTEAETAISLDAHATQLRGLGLEVAVAVTPPDMQAPLDRVRVEIALQAGGDHASPSGEWLVKFWALGPHKWREAIDGRHWKHGPPVYDYCMHGGNGVSSHSTLCV
jgi:hypothetical protein